MRAQIQKVPQILELLRKKGVRGAAAPPAHLVGVRPGGEGRGGGGSRRAPTAGVQGAQPGRAAGTHQLAPGGEPGGADPQGRAHQAARGVGTGHN